MRNMFKKPHNIMLYKERTEFEEFGHAKKNYRLCTKCKAVYFNKSWHHLKQLQGNITKKGGVITAVLCPACQMIKDNQHEGFILIENIPAKYEKELERLIDSYTKRAYEADCQHRLIKINKYIKTEWVVTTTENQLASKLAHKIREVFGKVKVKTVYAKAPDDVVRVKINFD